MTTIENKNLLLKLKLAESSDECSELLRQFYNETSHLVFAFCRKKGLTLENTEDVVQTVYIQIFKKRQRYNPDHSPLAWLYVITRSETKDFLKSLKTYKSYLDDFSEFASQTIKHNPSNEYERAKETENNLDILDNYADILSHQEVMALKMRYSDDKDFIEIAEHLNTSSMNIRKIISRGLKKIRERNS